MGRKRVIKFINRPVVPVSPVDPPDDIKLDAEAAAEWARVVTSLAPGHLLPCDVPLLTAYVWGVMDLRKLQVAAAGVEPVISTSSGYLQAHPLKGMLNKQKVLVSKLAHALGSLPGQRDRVARMPAEKIPGATLDEFSQFQAAFKRPRRLQK